MDKCEIVGQVAYFIAYRANALLHGRGEPAEFVNSSVANYAGNSTVIVDPLPG